MPRPSRTRRCCSAATRRRCREGRVTQFGPTHRGLPRAARPRHRADLLRSAAEHDRARKKGGERRCSTAASNLPVPAELAGHCRRRLHDRLPRPPSVARPRPDAGRRPVPATVSVTEITGSESFVHLDFARCALRRCWRLACAASSPAQAVEAYLDPRRSSSSTRPAARRGRAGAGGVRSERWRASPRPSRPLLRGRTRSRIRRTTR